MPYVHSVTYAAGTTGNQASIDFDPSIAPFNASAAVIVGAGATASFKLQFTVDNFDGPLMTDSAANWFDSTDIPAGTAASTTAAFITPVTRIRLVIAALSGGSLTLNTLQGLSTN